MNVEEWLVARLRPIERSVPGAWKARLKHLVRCLAGWVELPVEVLYYGYSQLRCWPRAGARHDDFTVVIVAPHLGSRAAIGHELPFSLRLAVRLREEGIRVQVLAHRPLSSGVIAAFERHGVACHQVFRHAGLGIVPGDVHDANIGALGRFAAHAFAYAGDLTLGLWRSGVGSPRLLVFPTSALSCMAGSSLLRWRSSSRASRLESQVHVLHRPPVLGGTTSYPALIRRRLRPLFRRGLYIGTVNPAVSAHLRALGETEAIPIPIPRSMEGRGRRPAGAPWRIGFVGSARVEKGCLILPRLLERLLDYDGSLRIVVQVTAFTDTPAVHAALAQVRRLAVRSTRLELVERVLSMDEYDDLLHGLDVVVLPYEPHSYALSISAVGVEAMAMGKVVVGPDVGWFAEQRALYGGYLGVDTSDPERIASRIVEAVEDFDRFARAAARDAHHFAWHNVQSLVNVLTHVAERDGLRRPPGLTALTTGRSGGPKGSLVRGAPR